MILVDVSQVYLLAAKLAGAGAQAVKPVGDAVEDTAEAVQRSAKQHAPVATGQLRDSITVERRPLSAEVGPTAPYAPFVEYGTSRMGPQPFMGPAVSQHEPGFPDRVADAAENTLERLL